MTSRSHNLQALLKQCPVTEFNISAISDWADMRAAKLERILLLQHDDS